MTLRDQAARADAATRYQVASVSQDQRYWDNRRAEHAAAMAADAHASRDLVVVNGRQVEPGSPVPVPQQQPAHVQSRAVATQKPPEMPSGRTWATTAQILDRWRQDGVGHASIEWWKRDGADPEADLAFAVPVMAGVLSGLDDADLNAVQGILAELGPGFEARLYKSAAAYARGIAPRAGDAASLAANSSQSKETTMATYNYGSDAEMKARYDALTPLIHRARARGDNLEYYALAAEREALGQRVHPGDGAPSPDNSGHRVG